MYQYYVLTVYEVDFYYVYAFYTVNSLCDFLKSKNLHYDDKHFYLELKWLNEDEIKERDIIVK